MSYHIPVAVPSRKAGQWHIVCDACSEANADWTYPCQSPKHRDKADRWPPNTLYEQATP